MAIDTQSLTDIITEFRALQSKDAVSPESLGYILQRIVDLLSTAGTSETVEKIQSLLDGFKAAEQAIVDISKSSGRHLDDIVCNLKTVNLATGEVSESYKTIISKATAASAGAMTAKHVMSLIDLKDKYSVLQNLLSELQIEIDTLKTAQNNFYSGIVPISLSIEGGNLFVRGADKLIEAGCIPYLFRNTRKRSRFGNTQIKKYCKPRKGWNLYGSCYTVKLDDTKLLFNSNPKNQYSLPAVSYSANPETIVSVHTNEKGIQTFAWGRSCVSLVDKNSISGNHRMIKLRFAIGFAPVQKPGRARITIANLVSTLAEFSIIYNPYDKSWNFSR